MRKKISSILFLFLLLCNALGFTVVTLWNEWKTSNTVRESSYLEVRDEELILKIGISLPYRENFRVQHESDKLAIYEGDFYKESEQIYENDTLYIVYKKQQKTRENIYGFLGGVHESLEQFSKKSKDTDPSKTLDFFKNLIKHYTQFGSNYLAFFWIEDLPTRNYSFIIPSFQSEISLSNPPPQVI